MERIVRYRGNVVLVKNLEETVSDESLRKEFSPFGRITSVEIVRDDESKRVGHAFICFSSSEEAARATEEMNGRVVGSKPVQCRLSDRKKDRQAYLLSFNHQLAKLQGRYIKKGAAKGYVPTQLRFAETSEVKCPRWITQTFPTPDAVPSCSNVTVQKHVTADPSDTAVHPLGDPKVPDKGLQGAAAFANQTEPPLDAYAPDEQKDILGEKLFPIIREMCYHLAGKITGMILELDNSRILTILENPAILRSTVEDAMAVLKDANYAISTASLPDKK